MDYKYSLTPDVVKYLISAVNSQQIRGEGEAKDLVAVLNILRTPENTEELEKKQLEELKSKHESLTKKDKKK